MNLRAVIVAVAVAVAVAASVLAGQSASAATRAATHSAQTFANCTLLHQVYVGGVATPGAHDRRAHGGHARYAPKVSAALYAANRKSDRDHVICSRARSWRCDLRRPLTGHV